MRSWHAAYLGLTDDLEKTEANQQEDQKQQQE
jgi:hypothetical protein